MKFNENHCTEQQNAAYKLVGLKRLNRPMNDVEAPLTAKNTARSTLITDSEVTISS